MGRNADGSDGDDRGMEPTERLDERTADAVLRGHLTVTDLGEDQRDLAELASFAAAVRSAASVPGCPNDELARVLAEGLPTPVPATAAGTVAPTSRSKRMIEIVAAKLAAAGLAAKAGLATAAVVAGTAGAGAAGMLPGELQTQLDALRGQEHGQVVVDEGDADGAALESTTTEEADSATVTEVTGVPDDLEAHDHRLGRAFGERTSEDAQDGGVDGEAIADEASEGRSTQAREDAAEASDGRSETGSEAAERRSAPDEIPAERPEQAPVERPERPEDTPRAQDAPPEEADRSEDGTERAPEDTSPPADRDTRGAPDGTPRG